MWTMIFQCALRRSLPDCLPAGLDTIEDLLEWRNDQTLLPKSFSLQSHLNWRAREPASSRNARNAAMISSCWRDLRPKVQLYLVAWLTNTRRIYNLQLRRSLQMQLRRVQCPGSMKAFDQSICCVVLWESTCKSQVILEIHQYQWDGRPWRCQWYGNSYGNDDTPWCDGAPLVSTLILYWTRFDDWRDKLEEEKFWGGVVTQWFHLESCIVVECKFETWGRWSQWRWCNQVGTW